MQTTRVDRWLSAARVYRSRTLAQQACIGGHVRVNDEVVRPSYVVRVDDEVRALAPRGLVVLKVLAIAEKRLSPELARALYVDHSPPPAPRGERVAPRPRGAGRPTKADRRAMDRFRGDE